MLKNRWVQLALSLLVSAGFIWYAVRGVDFARVGALLKTANYLYVLPTLVAYTLFQFVRVWRFRYLAAPVAEMSFPALFRIGNIGMMAIALLPVRLGEFVRPYLMKREFNVSLTASLGPVAAERVIDGLVVTLGFFAVTQSGLAIPPEMRHAGLLALLVFVSAAFVLGLVLIGHETGANFLRRVIAVVSPRLADRVVTLVTSFAHGLSALKRPRVLLIYLFWTLLFWGLSGMSNWTLFGTMGIELPVIAGHLLTALMVIALMLPSGPGFVGPIQAAIVWGLSLFGIDKETAFAFSILLHVSSFSVTIGFGLYSLLSAHISISTLVKESQQEAVS